MPQGKTAELRESCQPSMKNETWHRLTIVNLVEEGWCPSYLLPSTSINGLCVPQFALATLEEAANMSIIMERIQVSSVQMLEPKKVAEGSKFALEKIAMRGFWEKSLQDFVSSKSLIFLSMFLAVSIFFMCVILSLRVYTLAIYIIVTSIVLLSSLVFSFYKIVNLESHVAALQTELQNVFVNKTNRSFWYFLGILSLMLLIVLLVCVFFNFCAKCLCPTKYTKDWAGVVQKSTKIIESSIRRILLVKLVLIVPIIGLLVKAFLVVLAINSLCLLASPSIKEFRVVGACLDELCINNNTNKFFGEGDLCVPHPFK